MALRRHDASHEAALRILSLLDDGSPDGGSVQSVVRAIHAEGFTLTMPHSMDVLPYQALTSNAGILGVRVARELEKGNLRGDALIHDEGWNSFIVLRLRMKEAAQMRTELAAMDGEMWTNYTLFHQCAVAIHQHAIQARARSSVTAGAFHSTLKRAMEELQLCLTSAFEALRDAAYNVMLYAGAPLSIHDVDSAFILEPFSPATASTEAAPIVMTERAAMRTLHFPGRGQGPLTLPLHTVRHGMGVLSLRLVDVRAAFAAVTDLLRAGPPASPAAVKRPVAVSPKNEGLSSSLSFGSPGFNPASTLSHQLPGPGEEASGAIDAEESANDGGGIMSRLRDIANAVSSIVDAKEVGGGAGGDSRSTLASLGEQLSSVASVLMHGFTSRPSAALPGGRSPSPVRANLPGLLAATAGAAEVLEASARGSGVMRSPREVRRELSRERLASQPSRGRMSFGINGSGDGMQREASRSRSRSGGLSARPRTALSEVWDTVLQHTAGRAAPPPPLVTSSSAFNVLTATVETLQRGRTQQATPRTPASRSNSGTARGRTATSMAPDQLPFAAKVATASLSAASHRLGARVNLANASSRLADSRPAWRELWGLPPVQDSTAEGLSASAPAPLPPAAAFTDPVSVHAVEAAAADAVAASGSPSPQGRRAWNRLRNVLRAQQSFRAKLMTGEADAERVQKLFGKSSPKREAPEIEPLVAGVKAAAGRSDGDEAQPVGVVNVSLASRSPSPSRTGVAAATASTPLNLEDLATLPTEYHSPRSGGVPSLKGLPFLPASPEPHMLSSTSLIASQQRNLRQLRGSMASSRGRATAAAASVASPRPPPSSRSDAPPPSPQQLEELLRQISDQVQSAQPSLVDAILATSGGDNVPHTARSTWEKIGASSPRTTTRSSASGRTGVPKTPKLSLQQSSRSTPAAAEIAGRFVALSGHRVATPSVASAVRTDSTSRGRSTTRSLDETARTASTDDIAQHLAALASLPLPEDLLVSTAAADSGRDTTHGARVDAATLKAEIVQAIAGDWLTDDA